MYEMGPTDTVDKIGIFRTEEGRHFLYILYMSVCVMYEMGPKDTVDKIGIFSHKRCQKNV